MASSKSSSFTAFNDVDETVAKPVLGSDGAARWQDFRGGSKAPKSFSVAPSMPLKKLDRALGTTSIRDEQVNEAKIRKDAGDREAGSGYTTFKRKSDHEEHAERKKKKLILDKVRPDDVSYFMPAEEFEGYKFDYVFTKRDNRGLGYYWDGTDSARKETGLPPIHSESGDIVNDKNTATEKEKKPKTKKKKKKIREPIFLPDDEFNPMEQVALAIRRREQAMGAPPSSLFGSATNTKADAAALGANSSALDLASPDAEQPLETELIAAGWESTKDPSSGKTYFFQRSTNERSWTKPDLPKSVSGGNSDGSLPDGWKSAKDPKSGKVYYHHTSGKTSWEMPTS